MNVLGIDTSSVYHTIIGIQLDPNATLNLVLNEKVSQEQKLLPSIDTALSQMNTTLEKIELITVGIGPGSFTGLRIGVSVARGLAWSNHIPIVGVSSLELLAASFPSTDGIVVPIIDAKMKKVYASLFKNGTRINPDMDIEPSKLIQILEAYQDQTIHFIGNGVNTYGELFQNTPYTTVIHPDYSANGVILCQLGKKYLNTEHAIQGLEAVHPHYLRKSEAEKQLEKK